MVLKTKRLAEEALSLSIGRLMALRLGEKLGEFRAAAVLPVPMHWAKRFLRGVNSPELVAGCLGRNLGVPVVRNLVRCRYTGPQKDLLPRERFRNVRGAFRLRRSDRQRWQGSRLLLVDDILTTGATCSEIARLLKQSGAAAVAVAVVARADGSVKCRLLRIAAVIAGPWRAGIGPVMHEYGLTPPAENHKHQRDLLTKVQPGCRHLNLD